jgi:hypothetical protein
VIAVLAASAALVPASAATSASAAVPLPGADPFYSYTGSTPLANVKPGTVLKTRTLPYHVLTIATPVTAVQLLYRTTDALGQPSVNVTSVLLPPAASAHPKIVSYQSFYDSLSPNDEPSYAVSGGLTFGGLIPNIEALLIAPSLLAGNAVVFPDTEGEHADFAAGPEYGTNTLDSLRAALASPATGLASANQIGLLGYSGGAIATEWAAELAPTYAPEINRLLVGAAFGGVLVDPAHNLHYVDGSLLWAPVVPMALIGIARSYHIDLTPYMSAKGKQISAQLQDASIVNAFTGDILKGYSGLTWSQIAKPAYPQPETIPAYVTFANKLIMGTGGTPTVPLLIDQGAFGELEGTLGNKPGIGEGDGVMIAGDVRTLARGYCAKGEKVQYNQFPLDHISVAVLWLGQAAPWLTDRFAGKPAPQNCSSIAPGNSLAPIT